MRKKIVLLCYFSNIRLPLWIEKMWKIYTNNIWTKVFRIFINILHEKNGNKSSFLTSPHPNIERAAVWLYACKPVNIIDIIKTNKNRILLPIMQIIFRHEIPHLAVWFSSLFFFSFPFLVSLTSLEEI